MERREGIRVERFKVRKTFFQMVGRVCESFDSTEPDAQSLSIQFGLDLLKLADNNRDSLSRDLDNMQVSDPEIYQEVANTLDDASYLLRFTK